MWKGQDDTHLASSLQYTETITAHLGQTGATMIQEFSLTNIFSIKERQTLSFEVALKESEPSPHWVEMPDRTRLLRMACIYGTNASGKTNILQAYNLFMDFLLNGFATLKPDDPIPVTPFQFDPDTPHEPSSFELKFYLDGHRYIYAITMTRWQIISESLYWFETKQKKLVYRREANGEIAWGASITGNKKQITTMTKQNVPLLTMGVKTRPSIVCKGVPMPRPTDDLPYHKGL